MIQEQTKAGEQESVYDKIFLPALVLARRDRQDAGITAADEGFIFQATKDILASLDSEPATATTGSPSPEGADGQPVALLESQSELPANNVLVLGCPAHHEAEELSLAMLAQLLKPDRCRIEAVSTKALPAEVESRVKREGPALVFVAVLPPGGLVQARYLCKRLRKRFADLPIVVGYWGEERHYDKLLVRLRSAGASYVATSLLQSRSQIRALVSRAPGTDAGPSAREGLPIPVRGPAEATHAEGRTRT